MSTITSRSVLLVAACCLPPTGHAALEDRGGGLIYDTTRNITWLADMNFAKTSGQDADGLMDWTAAKTWADSLVFGGYSDWRLPTLNPADTSCTGASGPGTGYNCTGGELSGLLVTDLGIKPLESVLNPAGDTAEQIANLALFSNVQSLAYWSGTTYAPNPIYAYYIYTSIGSQGSTGKDVPLYAMAVRPGDVAVVPEPQTYAMMLLGITALMVAVRRRPC